MVIGEPGESFSEYAPSGTGVSAASGAEPTSPATEPANAVAEPVARQGSPAIEVTAAATPGASASSATGTVAAKPPSPPRARKLAAEKGVDTAQVAGTGPHGRIIKRDIIPAQGAPKSGLAKAMMADGGLQAPAAGSGIGGMVKGSEPQGLETYPTPRTLPEKARSSRSRRCPTCASSSPSRCTTSSRKTAQLTHMLGADARRVQALRKKAKKALEERKDRREHHDQ